MAPASTTLGRQVWYYSLVEQASQAGGSATRAGKAVLTVCRDGAVLVLVLVFNVGSEPRGEGSNAKKTVEAKDSGRQDDGLHAKAANESIDWPRMLAPKELREDEAKEGTATSGFQGCEWVDCAGWAGLGVAWLGFEAGWRTRQDSKAGRPASQEARWAAWGGVGRGSRPQGTGGLRAETSPVQSSQ
ncbi:hypothetical protein E4U55_005333 [Claviceps digitariae]|nr:hypothetical protein E4U55_005333 [Claviceps digitariae]